MFKRSIPFVLGAIALASASAFSATAIQLNQQALSPQVTLKEISRHTDFNQVTHIRSYQTFNGMRVWNANVITHTGTRAPVSREGTVYADLSADLANNAGFALMSVQADRALQQARNLHQQKTGSTAYDANLSHSEQIVFIDANKKAHYAYLISFLSADADGAPMVPTYILDANTLAVYNEWNNLQSLGMVEGGGFGGNLKTGKLAYDGSDYPKLDLTRNLKNRCLLKANNVAVHDDKNAQGPFSQSPLEGFACAAQDQDHNNLYWDADIDNINGGFSPANDALYIGTIVQKLYQDWYNVPVLTMYGMPLELNMHVHAKDMYGKPMDNAFFTQLTNGMYFGDGVKLFYPLTSLGVGAHELSHGFTSGHSNLVYENQSGGLNESFSDMAAQAAEYYARGTNNWQIGPEIFKGEGALRYMDNPPKDGHSIGHIRDYNDGLNVHYSSGIFNKAFYRLATTKGWNTRKAFDVMVKANMDYWKTDSTFQDAACGVMKATKDYGYPTGAVTRAFKGVGINTAQCG